MTLTRLAIDRLCVPLWLRWLGIRVSRGCRFVGYPVIRLSAGAQITLGEGVKLVSRMGSNPAGLSHPIMLSALTPESSIRIGDHTALSGASIVARSAVTIGRNVLIGAGACIWDTDFHPTDPAQRREHPTRDARCAPIAIADDVFVGARAIILKGVTVGWGAVIGAGAVVTRDVGACEIVAGNPAKSIGSVAKEVVREQ